MSKVSAANEEMMSRLANAEATSRRKNIEQITEVVVGFIDWWVPIGHPIVEQPIITSLYEHCIKPYWDKFDHIIKKRIISYSYLLVEKMLQTYFEPTYLINPLTGKNYADDVQYNNFHSIRIYMVAYIAQMINDMFLLDWSHDYILKQIHENINDDGSTFDYEHRDSLGYHVYNMKPLVKTILILNSTQKYKAFDYYNYYTKKSNTIKKAIHFLTPYVSGEKTHRMLVKSHLASDKNSKNYDKVWSRDDAKWLLADVATFDSEIKTVYHNTWVNKKIT